MGYLGAILLAATLLLASQIDAAATGFFARNLLLLSLGANVLGLALVVCGFGQARTGNPLGFALSGRNAFSLSRLQMACWTVLVVGALVTIVEVNLFRFGGGAAAFDVAVPGSVFALLGIAALSTAATPAILSLKTTQPSSPDARQDARLRVAEASNIQMDQVRFLGRLQQVDAPAQARLIDLVSGEEVGNAGTIDISKVQQLLISGLVMAIYAGLLIVELNGATARIAGLPEINERLAELLGVSHASYLAYKAVPKPAGRV